MHSHYTILSFGSDPTLHLQAHGETEVLCGHEGALAIPHLPVPTLLEYAPHEIGIIVISGALDGSLLCETCATVVDQIIDLEDDLIEMEYGQTA